MVCQGAGTEVAGGLFVAPIEAVEDREHDEEAERQGPRELRTEAGGGPMHGQA